MVTRLLLILVSAISCFITCAQDEADLYRKATDLYYQGKYELALSTLDSAIALNDDDISRYFYRSKINEKLGDYEAAIMDLTTCIDRSEHDATYLIIRAEFYVKIGKESLAMDDLNSSIELKPNWRVYFNRGMLFVKQNQYIKAMADFNQSIKMNENQADPLRARAYLKNKMGDPSGACIDMYDVYEMGFDDALDWINRNCGG